MFILFLIATTLAQSSDTTITLVIPVVLSVLLGVAIICGCAIHYIRIRRRHNWTSNPDNPGDHRVFRDTPGVKHQVSVNQNLSIGEQLRNKTESMKRNHIQQNRFEKEDAMGMDDGEYEQKSRTSRSSGIGQIGKSAGSLPPPQTLPPLPDVINQHGYHPSPFIPGAQAHGTQISPSVGPFINGQNSFQTSPFQEAAPSILGKNSKITRPTSRLQTDPRQGNISTNETVIEEAVDETPSPGLSNFPTTLKMTSKQNIPNNETNVAKNNHLDTTNITIQKPGRGTTGSDKEKDKRNNTVTSMRSVGITTTIHTSTTTGTEVNNQQGNYISK